MKSQRLIDALGQIDERLVLDVIPAPIRKKKRHWPAALGAAAMIGICLFGLSRLNLQPSPAPLQSGSDIKQDTAAVMEQSTTESLPMLTLGTTNLWDGTDIAYVSDPSELLDLGIQDFTNLPDTLPVYTNLYPESEQGVPENWEPDYENWCAQVQQLADQLEISGTVGIDADNGIVALYGENGGSIKIDSQQNILLCDTVNFLLDSAVDESSCSAMEQAAQTLLQTYDFGFAEATATVCRDSNNFSAYLYDGSGTFAERLVSMSFRGIQCCFSFGELYMVWIRNTQLGEMIGEYPILSPEEAEECLRNGAGSTMFPAEDPNLEIGAMGLVYLTMPWQDCYMPFYWFRVALPENSPYQRSDETRAYALYYLPAVQPEYLTDLPHWQLSVNPTEFIKEQLTQWDGTTMNETIRAAFGAYFSLHSEELQFLPEFVRGTAPGWDDVTLFVLRTKGGILSEEELSAYLSSKFEPMEYADQSSAYLNYTDGFYEGPSEEYQDDSSFYRLDTISEVEPGVYKAVFEGFALSWTDLNPGYESPASGNRILLDNLYDPSLPVEQKIREALSEPVSLEELGFTLSDRITVTVSLQEGDSPFLYLGCERMDQVGIIVTQSDLEVWGTP